MSIINEPQDQPPTSDVTDQTIGNIPHSPNTSNDRRHRLSNSDELQGTISGGESTTPHTDSHDEGSIQNNHTLDPVAASDPPEVDLHTKYDSERGEQPREMPRSTLPASEPIVAPIREKDAINSRELFAPRRLILLGFSGMFVIMIISLEILNYLSHRYAGIATVEQKAHYLWIYAPTLSEYL